MGHFITMSQAWVVFCVVAGICGVAAFFFENLMRQLFSFAMVKKKPGSRKGSCDTPRPHHGQMGLFVDQPQTPRHDYDSQSHMFHPQFMHGFVSSF
jgi:hypothetical protein